MTIETFTLVMIFIAYVTFAGKRMLTYMHVLQQEDYDNGRLTKWIFNNKAYDKRLTVSLLFFGGLLITLHFSGHGDLMPDFFKHLLIFVMFVMTSYIEKDPRKSSKKKLVSTARAKRIFIPALIVALIMGIPHFFIQFPWAWIVNVQAIPYLLIFVNICLKPFEDIIQVGYWREANDKVKEINPTVIAITGSYGKTSVKHILAHVLSRQAPTLVTPGSVNTPMGITRVIREQLEPNHRYLIVEMGAYGPGSIGRLCKLTPPDYGIISSIGHAHYERFKSLDAVARTKFELAEAVIRNEGKCVIHERTLRFNFPRKLKNEFMGNFIVAGDAPEVDKSKRKDVTYILPEDLQVHNIEQKPNGLAMKFSYNKITYSPEAPLFGLHHGYNLALVFALCVELGISTDAIQDAFATMPQIKHRLEVKKLPDGITIIDDAYNSNPVGFASALAILAALGKSGRKILITPGMIELGLAHDEAHAKIGETAGEVCDICIVVTPKRIPTFVNAFKAKGKTLIEYDSFAEAQDWVNRNKQDGDVILIENDLPDMYERIPKM